MARRVAAEGRAPGSGSVGGLAGIPLIIAVDCARRPFNKQMRDVLPIDTWRSPRPNASQAREGMNLEISSSAWSRIPEAGQQVLPVDWKATLSAAKSAPVGAFRFAAVACKGVARAPYGYSAIRAAAVSIVVDV